MLTRSSVAAPTRAETKVSVPPVKVKAAKAIDARLSPYGDREGPLVPGERGGMFSRRNHVEASRVGGLSAWRSGEEHSIRRPAERGTRDGKEVWRYICGWALQAHAPSLRLVDEASSQEVPGKRAESCAEAGRHPTVGS